MTKDGWLDFLVPAGVIIGGFVALTALASIPAIAISAYACKAQADTMHVEWSYGPFQDCMVKVGGGFIPLANYRRVDQ